MAVEDAHGLFGLDPEGFVAARDELARSVRTAGAKDEARQIKALRRPTVPVWALNQVARDHSSLVDELVDASTAALAAKGTSVREALARRRDALHEVARAARRVIEGSGRSPDAHEVDIVNGLNAIVASRELVDALRRGELTRLEPAAEAGLEWPDLGDVEVPLRRDRETVASTGTRRTSRELTRARAELERRRVTATEAAARVEETRRALAAAEDAVARAEQRVAELEE